MCAMVADVWQQTVWGCGITLVGVFLHPQYRQNTEEFQRGYVF